MYSVIREVELNAEAKADALGATLKTLKECERECIMLSGDILKERDKHSSLMEQLKETTDETSKLSSELTLNKKTCLSLTRQRDALLAEKTKQQTKLREMSIQIEELQEDDRKVC